MKVILLHGLGQQADDYAALCHFLMEKGLEPEVVSLPFSANFQDMVYETRDRLQQVEEPFLLFGLSLGGVLGLALASDLPNCYGLMVSGAQYSLKGNVLFDLQIAIMSLLPRTFYSKKGLDKQTLLALQSSMKGLDLTEQVTKISLPTLVICGSKDKPNLSASRQLKELLPQAQLVILEGGGHALNAEKPADLAGLFVEFRDQFF